MRFNFAEIQKYAAHLVRRAKKITLAEAKPWLIALAAVVFIAAIIITHTPRAGKVAFKEYDVVLSDYSGKEVRFSSFKQQPIVVFFWATWSPYSAAELQHLATLKQQYGGNVQILAVNRGESFSDAKAFTDKLNLPGGMIFLLDNNDQLFKHLKGYAMPETVFVNSRGEEAVHQHGPLKPEEADADIKSIL